MIGGCEENKSIRNEVAHANCNKMSNLYIRRLNYVQLNARKSVQTENSF